MLFAEPISSKVSLGRALRTGQAFELFVASEVSPENRSSPTVLVEPITLGSPRKAAARSAARKVRTSGEALARSRSERGDAELAGRREGDGEPGEGELEAGGLTRRAAFAALC
jgi:hypothetical protein